MLKEWLWKLKIFKVKQVIVGWTYEAIYTYFIKKLFLKTSQNSQEDFNFK